jgi:asparagine synthase (glutamine-hydrolysing)
VVTEQDAVGMVDEYMTHFDEPFADTSAIPTMLVSKLARNEVTVALTGDGGDELFLGYGAHVWANRLDQPAWLLLRPLLRNLLALLPSSRLHRIAHLFDREVTQKPRQHIFSQEQYFFSEHELLTEVLADRSVFREWDYTDVPAASGLTPAERQALFDLRCYLKDDLLVKVDRASMRYGLECRSPLLDHRLIEFVLNLPAGFKMRHGKGKLPLKKFLFEMVPASFFDRPKRGFAVPLAKWLRTDLRHLLDTLDGNVVAETGLFDGEFVEKMKYRFLKGEDYLYHRLWALVIIQKYMARYPLGSR